VKICDDLMTAARFMTDDGFSLDAGERIAPFVRSANILVADAFCS
jgi:hypothetical protein